MMYSVVRFALIVATAACLSPQIVTASEWGPTTWDAIKEPTPSPTIQDEGETPSLAAPPATVWGPTTWDAQQPTADEPTGSTTVSVTADEDSAAWTVSVAASLASFVLAAVWLR